MVNKRFKFLLNCYGVMGRKGFDRIFVNKFGRFFIWEEFKFYRLKKGKFLDKLYVFLVMYIIVFFTDVCSTESENVSIEDRINVLIG